jgi:hypothetical protein
VILGVNERVGWLQAGVTYWQVCVVNSLLRVWKVPRRWQNLNPKLLRRRKLDPGSGGMTTKMTTNH